MKVVCAWCGKDMREKEPLEDKSITHGMCEECYEKMTGAKGGEPVLTRQHKRKGEPVPGRQQA